VLPDVDDPIADEILLYRRINPAAPHVVWDENFGCHRISTGAFRDPDMSVGIGDTLEALLRDPTTLLQGYQGQYLVSFAAGVAKDNGLEVIRSPSGAEPAHGSVRGKKSKPVLRALAAACAWTVTPDGACEPPYPEG
jgi:hypothetical protein